MDSGGDSNSNLESALLTNLFLRTGENNSNSKIVTLYYRSLGVYITANQNREIRLILFDIQYSLFECSFSSESESKVMIVEKAKQNKCKLAYTARDHGCFPLGKRPLSFEKGATCMNVQR